jgi:hypothetical protein
MRPPDAATPYDSGSPADSGLDNGVDAASPIDAMPSMDAVPGTDTPGADAVSTEDGAFDAGFWDSGPDAGFTTITITDENGTPIMITEGPSGPPSIIGCADGNREGLHDMATFPGIAACLGTWTGTASLRAPSTGQACGNDLVGSSTCAVPADLCATGWHVCSSTGAVSDLKNRLTMDQCDNAGGGRYVAAISHCVAQSGCQYDYSPSADYPCFPSGWCSESVCCGLQCRQFGACPSGVWVGDTHIAQGVDQGCAMITSRRAGGVLCCRW